MSTQECVAWANSIVYVLDGAQTKGEVRQSNVDGIERNGVHNACLRVSVLMYTVSIHLLRNVVAMRPMAVINGE